MESEQSSTFKDKVLGLYGIGVIGFTCMNYSSDGIWLAIGKPLIWPITIALYLVDTFHS